MHEMQDATSLEQALINQSVKLKQPINAALELTPLCNMKCKMCYVTLSSEEMKAKGGYLTFEQWKKIIDDMKEAGVLFVLLTGGEPLTYPYFKEIYLYLREQGFFVTINTNGTLINEKWGKFFGEHKPRRMNITIYGSSEDTYRNLCGYSGGFEKCINGIKILKKNNIDVTTACSLTIYNKEEVLDIVRIAHELDCKITVDTYMLPTFRKHEVRVDPLQAAKIRDEVRKLCLNQEEYNLYASTICKAIDEYQDEEKKKGFECLATNCSFSINYQGDMLPCVISSGPKYSALNESVSECFKKLNQHGESVKINEQCNHCKYSILCRTCPTSALLETGRYDGLSDYVCSYAKELYQIMKRYLNEKDI